MSVRRSGRVVSAWCSPGTIAGVRITDENVKNPQEVLVANLDLVERICRYVAHRQRFSPEDTDEAVGIVQLKLVENDYSILRQFEEKSALSTYLTIVITRICLDIRAQQWGKWRPSAEARRLGDRAVELEALIARDGLSQTEAIATVARSSGVDSSELQTLSAALPSRVPRPRRAAADTLRQVAAGDQTDDAIIRSESQQHAFTARKLLDREIALLPAEDQLILRLRFREGMQIATIASIIDIEARKLYRHLEQLFSTLRDRLRVAGLDDLTARELLLAGADGVELNLFAAADGKESSASVSQNKSEVQEPMHNE